MNLILVSFLSGIFWSLPYMTSLLAPTIFFALIPVLYFIYSRKACGLKYFLLTALFASCISLFQVRHYSFRAYLLSVFITVAFAVVFLTISRKLIYLTGRGKLSLFVPATAWTVLCLAFNYQSFLTGSFDLGIALPYTAPVIWYIGSIGITYLVILFSSAVAKYIALKNGFSLFVIAGVAAIFLASISYSLTKDASSLAGKEEPVKVSLIQNNVAESWEWLQRNPYRVLRVQQELTREAAKENPDIIVWPEYSLPLDITNSRAVVRDAVGEVAREAQAKLVLGSIIFDETSGWHDDIALVLDEKGRIVGSRSSVNPAPFNKYTNRSQTRLDPVEGFGTVICWEELDPEVSRKYVNNGASFLIALTNNQDFDNTSLKFYTPFYSRARAAENMRYFARSTNTGVTQIIDPLGRIVKALKPDVQGTLTAEIYPIEKKTFYTKRGHLIVVLVNILVGGCLFFTVFKFNHIKKEGWFV